MAQYNYESGKPYPSVVSEAFDIKINNMRFKIIIDMMKQFSQHPPRADSLLEARLKEIANLQRKERK